MKVLLLLLVAANICFAQDDIDSLKPKLKDDKTRAYYLSVIANRHLARRQYDSAIYFLHLSLNEPQNTVPWRASSLNSMGVAFGALSIMDSSIFYYQYALRLYEESKDESNAAVTESNLAIILKNRGSYDRALEYAFSAIDKLEPKGFSETVASCYNTIALIYSLTREFDKSLEYHFKALEMRKELKLMTGVGQSYNNIGDAYLSLKKYDSAKLNLQKALSLKLSLGEKAQVTLNNLGDVELKQGHLDEAESYFRRSLAVRIEIKDQVGEATVRNNLGITELMRKSFPAAMSYLHESEAIAKRTGSLEQLRISLENQVKIFEMLGDFKNAFHRASELLLVKDSLLNKSKVESLHSMQVAYETDQKEQRIATLQEESRAQQLESENDRLLLRLLFIAGTFLVIVIALVVNRYQLLARSKKKVDTLLKELNHRVKNNLQMLSSLLILQSQTLTDKNAVEAVKSSEGRVNAMAAIHRRLSVHDERQEVDMKEYISEICEYLTRSYGFAAPAFSLDLHLHEISISVEKAIQIGLILNELVTNACKYAFGDGSNHTLTVEFENVEGRLIVLRIKDNGGGMNIRLEDAKSFGLNLVKTIAKDLKAVVSVDVKDGTDYRISMPISNQ